jgi:hypothetical protein
VIITGRMPAASQTCTASRASARGGSIIATRPSSVIRLSASAIDVQHFLAIASTRKPSPAMRCSTARIRSRPTSVSGTSSPDRKWVMQLANTSSAAPFENATTPDVVV